MSRKQIELSVIVQDLCLAFIINSAATILNGGFAGTGVYLVGMFMAFCINYIAGLIIPVDKIGCGAARLLHMKEGKWPFKLVRVFVINAIFVTIISFTIALINVGPHKEVFGIWWQTYWILHLVGFMASVLLDEPIPRLIRAFTEKDNSGE